VTPRSTVVANTHDRQRCNALWVMGAANTSDQDVKMFQRCDRRRGQEECHSAVGPFGDAVELELRSELFRDAIEGKRWGSAQMLSIEIDCVSVK
jgi:hypothetical protein